MGGCCDDCVCILDEICCIGWFEEVFFFCVVVVEVYIDFDVGGYGVD